MPSLFPVTSYVQDPLMPSGTGFGGALALAAFPPRARFLAGGGGAVSFFAAAAGSSSPLPAPKSSSKRSSSSPGSSAEPPERCLRRASLAVDSLDTSLVFRAFAGVAAAETTSGFLLDGPLDSSALPSSASEAASPSASGRKASASLPLSSSLLCSSPPHSESATNSSGKSFISKASACILPEVPFSVITPSATETRPLLARRSTACCTPRRPSTEPGTVPSAESCLCTSSHEARGRLLSFAKASRVRSASAAFTQISRRLSSFTVGASRVDWCWQPRTYLSCGSSASETRIPTMGTPPGWVTARTIFSLAPSPSLSLLLPLAGAEARRQALSTSPVRTCSWSSLLCVEDSYNRVQPSSTSGRSPSSMRS
mmetsp:Transcript_144322/g.448131  ORF Transcript_144322/g.448131 Transcript_144322/m.448131 type:complete len:370 (-) Transcript_144322:125-1234(-)